MYQPHICTHLLACTLVCTSEVLVGTHDLVQRPLSNHVPNRNSDDACKPGLQDTVAEPTDDGNQLIFEPYKTPEISEVHAR